MMVMIAVDTSDLIIAKELLLGEQTELMERLVNPFTCPDGKELSQYKLAAVCRLINGINEALDLPDGDGIKYGPHKKREDPGLRPGEVMWGVHRDDLPPFGTPVKEWEQEFLFQEGARPSQLRDIVAREVAAEEEGDGQG